jgi:CRP-like cAMP-binding protein
MTERFSCLCIACGISLTVARRARKVSDEFQPARGRKRGYEGHDQALFRAVVAYFIRAWSHEAEDAMGDALTALGLQRLAFVEGLPPENLERLAEIASPASWGPGEVIFREGQRDSRLYVIEEGRVALELAQLGRGRVTIMTIGPGEVLGWSSLYQGRPKTATARTVQPTRAVAFDADRLRALCDTDPRLGYHITRQILSAVAERLQATRLQLLDVFGDPSARQQGDS